jgi:hypothetical protein
MSKTPLTYTLKKASQLISIDTDNFQSLYVEGELRLAYLNIYNGKPILGYLPVKKFPENTNLNLYLRDNPIADESLSKHVKFDLPFFYLSSFALSVHLRKDQELSSPIVEDFKGNAILLVQERFNQEELYFTEAGFSLENPIIPREEIDRYLKVNDQDTIKINTSSPYVLPNNPRERPRAIVYFANKFYDEFQIKPSGLTLRKYMLKSKDENYPVTPAPRKGYILINEERLSHRAVADGLRNYTNKHFEEKN